MISSIINFIYIFNVKFMREFSDYIVLIALTDVYDAALLVQMLSVFFSIVSVIVYLWFPAPEFDLLLFGCCHSILKYLFTFSCYVNNTECWEIYMAGAFFAG